MIGINQLSGEEEILSKPITVARVLKDKSTQDEKILKIQGEISKKIVFKNRPVPIMNFTRVKTAE